MMGVIAFHVLMLLLGIGVATRVVPEQLTNDALTYLHTTIGITTPTSGQAWKIALIWIGATVAIVDGCLGLLFLIASIVK